MEKQVLKSETEYPAAIERTLEIFDAKPDDANFDELQGLLISVRVYEDKHYKVPTRSA